MRGTDTGGAQGRLSSSAAGSPQPPAAMPGLVPGRVFALDAAQQVGVTVGDECLWAQRSLSCVLAPEVGDRVLVARVDGEAFVLAILDRLLPDTMTLSVPHARCVALSAPDIAITAEVRLALRARDARLEGESVRILATSFSLVGRLATLVADLLRTTARRTETAADEMAVQAGERTTRVRGTDVSAVGTSVRRVEEVSVETAQSAVLVAKDDLRFDGTRVTVG
ncbi:DUF3540 domain-containing protein [Xanthobacter agilis]|uniref:DUF3540 domain-containing protein n=1 Tax=Xanthobacter agilis TaxID=47492 RepID=UPI0037262AD8